VLSDDLIRTIYNGREVDRRWSDRPDASVGSAMATSPSYGPQHDELPALDRIVSPLSPEIFLADYWEKRPFTPRREGSSLRFSDLMTLREFDKLVTYGNLHHPFVRIFRQEKMVLPEQFCTRRQTGSSVERDLADLNLIYDAYLNGNTIVLQSVERISPQLSSFCREIEERLDCSLQADVVLSPPNTFGPLTQYDSCSTFVLQAEGTSQWEIHNRLPEPQDNTVPATVENGDRRSGVIDTITLTPGDSLYVPRSFLYRERILRSHSLHLFIRATVIRWIDLFRLLCERVLSNNQLDIRYRQALPVGRPPGGALPPQLMSHFSDMVRDLLADADMPTCHHLITQKFRAARLTRSAGTAFRFERTGDDAQSDI
jgi:ribosomal protein L16 Arg81 hydroxylase